MGAEPPADLLNGRVLLLCGAVGVQVWAIRTDSEREHCVTAGQPSPNGYVERMYPALPNECFRVAGRTSAYISPEEIQRELDPLVAA